MNWASTFKSFKDSIAGDKKLKKKHVDGFEKALQVAAFYLEQQPEYFGFEKFPMWKRFITNDRTETFHLGTRIGMGEDCTVFACNISGGGASQRNNSLVVKFYKTDGAARKEDKIYNVAQNVSHTTKLLPFPWPSLTDPRFADFANRFRFVTPHALCLISKLPDGISFGAQHVEQVVEALRALHRAGIAHGDIQRQNLFLTRDGREALINDFGRSIVKDEVQFAQFREQVRVDWKRLREALQEIEQSQ